MRLGDDGSPLQCRNCRIRRHCLPRAARASDFDRLEASIVGRHTLNAGSTLYRAGERFAVVHVVRLGSLKSVFRTPDGRRRTTGFHLPGDWLGFDGIDSGRYRCDVVALELTDICAVSYDRLLEDNASAAALRRHVQDFMSREISRQRKYMLVLGTLPARERVATFLFDLSERTGEYGYSRSDLFLRMSRDDIASFLGLTIETVSRALSRFAEAGLIDVDRRCVHIRRADALRSLAVPTTEGPTRRTSVSLPVQWFPPAQAACSREPERCNV